MSPGTVTVSKRHHNFGTKHFKEKSLFIFHACIVLKSLILLFVRLIVQGARIGKTHTQTHRQTHRHTDRHTHRQTDRQTKYCNPRACMSRVNKKLLCMSCPPEHCVCPPEHCVCPPLNTVYAPLSTVYAPPEHCVCPP